MQMFLKRTTYLACGIVGILSTTLQTIWHQLCTELQVKYHKSSSETGWWSQNKLIACQLMRKDNSCNLQLINCGFHTQSLQHCHISNIASDTRNLQIPCIRGTQRLVAISSCIWSHFNKRLQISIMPSYALHHLHIQKAITLTQFQVISMLWEAVWRSQFFFRNKK